MWDVCKYLLLGLLPVEPLSVVLSLICLPMAVRACVSVVLLLVVVCYDWLCIEVFVVWCGWLVLFGIPLLLWFLAAVVEV